MKLAQSILMLPRPPRRHGGEVSHLMIGLRLPGEVRRRRIRNGRVAVEDMDWQALAGPPRPNSPRLSASGARKPRF